MPAPVPVSEHDILVFRGSASPRLTAAICKRLGVAMGESEVIRFSEGTLFVRLLQNVRGRDVFLVQPPLFPANEPDGAAVRYRHYREPASGALAEDPGRQYRAAARGGHPAHPAPRE